MKIHWFHHWLYPLLVAGLFFSLLLALFTNFYRESHAERIAQERADALVMREYLVKRFQGKLSYLTLVVEELLDEPETREHFSKKNQRVLEHYQEILALYYLNSNNQVLFKAARSGSFLPEDRNLSLPEVKETLANAQNTSTPGASPIFSLLSGERVILIHIPLVRQGRYLGNLAAIISVHGFIKQSLSSSFLDRYRVSLVGVSESTLPLLNSSPTSNSEPRLYSLVLPGVLSSIVIFIQAYPARYYWQIQDFLLLSLGLAVFVGSAILGLSRDNKRRRQVEVELKKAMQAANDANRSKNEFLANISHEIRSPLGVIKGFCELARQEGSASDHWPMLISRIERNAENLLSLVSDILDLSKVEAGLIEISKEWLQLQEFLADIVDTLSPTALSKGLLIQLMVDKSCPHYINTDPLRLRQILYNVIGNAIKFTELGTITLRVTSKLREDAFQEEGKQSLTRLWIEVEDTGIGVDEKGQKQLFQAFSQADTSIARRYGGTGLGLVLSRRLARLLAGDLILKSSHVKQGSCFLLCLDLESRAEPSQEITKKSQQDEARNGRCLAGQNILVVDDCADNQLIHQVFLSQAGAAVTLASSGEDAIQKVGESRPDAILMDIQMPYMDGYEVTRKILSLGIKVPIIALSAHAMKGEREKAIAAGCLDYLVKPVDSQLLIQTILQFLNAESDKGVVASPESNDAAMSQPLPLKRRALKNSAMPKRSAQLRGERSPLPPLLIDDPLIGPILQRFLVNSLQKVKAIDEGLKKKEWNEVARFAHQMRGSSAQYGYPQFEAAAAAIEKACGDSPPNLSELDLRIHELSDLVARAWEGFCASNHRQ